MRLTAGEPKPMEGSFSTAVEVPMLEKKGEAGSRGARGGLGYWHLRSRMATGKLLSGKLGERIYFRRH
ncbi:hypothetical protein ZHAS_00003394 [Anopheles sinensis]|uniref:Uncharacterized protein n=1 Tax=Anopheles sinensis TaxID=74873 RepID=A0A084VE81_ANOSI|nr:hypothetical protein ZHAS_00003394 [Anopheles sinensis]